MNGFNSLKNKTEIINDYKKNPLRKIQKPCHKLLHNNH